MTNFGGKVRALICKLSWSKCCSWQALTSTTSILRANEKWVKTSTVLWALWREPSLLHVSRKQGCSICKWSVDQNQQELSKSNTCGQNTLDSSFSFLLKFKLDHFFSSPCRHLILDFTTSTPVALLLWPFYLQTCPTQSYFSHCNLMIVWRVNLTMSQNRMHDLFLTPDKVNS